MSSSHLVELNIANLKSVQGKVQVDLDSETVQDLKTKALGVLGLTETPDITVVMVVSGKFLKVPDQKLSDFPLKDGSTIVVTTRKAPAGSVPPPQAAPTPAPAPVAAPAPVPQQPQSQATVSNEATPAPSSTGPAAAANTDNTTGAQRNDLALGPEYESAVMQLMELGYDREQVLRAMRAAYRNPDRAAEYLMTGTVDQVLREQEMMAGAGIPVAPGAGDDQGEGDDDADDGDEAPMPAEQQAALGHLLQHIQSDPSQLAGLIQMISQDRPELAERFASNPQALVQFLQLLALTGGVGPAGAGIPGLTTGGDNPSQAAPRAPAAGGPAGQVVRVQLTAEEAAAVDRIIGMGFSRDRVIQAFLACDRNEEYTINFLLSDM